MIRHAAHLNGLPALIPDDPTYVIVQWLLDLVANERQPTLGAENEMVEEVRYICGVQCSAGICGVYISPEHNHQRFNQDEQP